MIKSQKARNRVEHLQLHEKTLPQNKMHTANIRKGGKTVPRSEDEGQERVPAPTTAVQLVLEVLATQKGKKRE